MLSDRSRPVIEATLPVVGENIAEIARRFYQHMFAGHPELLDGISNRGNQAEGTQQVALAGSVAAFAALRHVTSSTRSSDLTCGRPTCRPTR
jgi:nitric oxide dioxygenase